MQKVSGLPSTLPEDVSSVLARVESSESWVKLDSNFGEGQLKLLKMLGAYKSHLPQKMFLEHFVVIATFSKFRDAVTLMQALEVNHGWRNYWGRGYGKREEVRWDRIVA